MAGADLINAGDFAKITALSREAVLSLLGFSFAHIGINASGGEAAACASQLASLFGFARREGPLSVFAGDAIEVVKGNAPGTHGHIAIATNSVTRAIAHLERSGVAFNHASAKKDASGKVVSVYLKEEILGFAVHLVQRN
jgi:2-dehydro-3-deoxyphosphogluconate aldolase/(4S)-4-hydroxy-2-oxoglutarate aldolase